VVLPDSNIITLYDYDCNGFFTDDYDKIMAGDIQQNSRLGNNPVKTKKSKPGVELPYANNTYKVTGVDKYGNSITVLPLNKVIDTVEKLPAFKFTDEVGDKKNFGIISAKPYSVLYIWGAWCIGCVSQAPGFVRVMKKYESMTDFYTFNYGDKEDIMLNYIAAKKMPFKPDWISNSIIKILQVESFPSYLIVDKMNHIVLRSSSVYEVEQFFANIK
jgi:thiol-disulfide isomerase/thioredoxin